MTILKGLLMAALATHAAASYAVTFSGYVNDAANPALVHSDLGPALFGDDFEIANNVALHNFSVAAPGSSISTATGSTPAASIRTSRCSRARARPRPSSHRTSTRRSTRAATS